VLPFAEVWKVTETGPVNVSKEYADESHPDVPSFIALFVVVVALLPINVNESQRDTTYEFQNPLFVNHTLASVADENVCGVEYFLEIYSDN